MATAIRSADVLTADEDRELSRLISKLQPAAFDSWIEVGTNGVKCLYLTAFGPTRKMDLPTDSADYREFRRRHDHPEEFVDGGTIEIDEGELLRDHRAM